jgi:hypothetical protein
MNFRLRIENCGLEESLRFYLFIKLIEVTVHRSEVHGYYSYHYNYLTTQLFDDLTRSEY